MNKIFKDDIGTKIILDIDPEKKYNITSNDIVSATILVTKPDGYKVEWNAIPDNNKIYYITEVGDIDQKGTYDFQAKVQLISGWSGRGEHVKEYVFD